MWINWRENERRKYGRRLYFVDYFIFLIGMFLQFVTIHQFGALGMIGGDENLAKPSYAAFMNDYGKAYRSFGHGALHSFYDGNFLCFSFTCYQCNVWKKILEICFHQHRILDDYYYFNGRNYLWMVRNRRIQLGDSKIILI